MTRHRRGRATLRCITEDLELPRPSLDEPIDTLEHGLLDELRRLAPTSPQGQKLVESIKPPPMVFRLRWSRYRGATWVDHDDTIVWLLASAMREEGSSDDAFDYFAALHASDRLCPSDDDRLRYAAEAGHRFLRAVADQVPDLIERAWFQPGTEVADLLGGSVGMRLFAGPSSDLRDLWVALSRQDAEGNFIEDRVRDSVFALVEQALGPCDWQEQDPSAWPTRRLQWEWVARLYVH